MPPPPKTSKRPCAVYRLFAYTGQLAYIGCSVNPDDRWRQLQSEMGRDWIRHVVTHRTVEWYKTVKRARDGETQAIRDEQPLFNVHIARRGWTAPMIRWLRPEGEDPIPCLYRGVWWLIGRDEVAAVVNSVPASTGDPLRDVRSKAYHDAIVGLYNGSLDEFGAACLTRPEAMRSWSRPATHTVPGLPAGRVPTRNFDLA